MVETGRRKFLEQFPSIADFEDELKRLLVQPESEETFLRCKLDHGERERHAPVYRLHRDLLALRRNDKVFRQPRQGQVDGAVLGSHAFLLRFFGQDDDDRLLLINLGRDLRLAPAADPLLAPVAGRHWELLWTSELPAYGGSGTPAVDAGENWVLPGHAAILLHPIQADPDKTL
jgi:maltooligosyltrehalose trehalohydrolase